MDPLRTVSAPRCAETARARIPALFPSSLPSRFSIACCLEHVGGDEDNDGAWIQGVSVGASARRTGAYRVFLRETHLSVGSSRRCRSAPSSQSAKVDLPRSTACRNACAALCVSFAHSFGFLSCLATQTPPPAPSAPRSAEITSAHFPGRRRRIAGA